MLRAFFLEGLLRNGEPDHGDAQWNTFHGWMQAAVVALRAGRIQQAQVLAVAGPADCGKSLLQQLITRMLGGRAVKAAHFMNGRTDFNAELFTAEHLMLEDEFMSTRISDRLRLAAAIKQLTVSTSTAACYRKRRDPVNLPAWWRGSITLSDDPEALLVLPPLDDHVADKIILLRATRFALPMPTASSEQRDAFWQALVAAVPGYLHWLLNEFAIPEAHRDPKRYIVATWQHPEIRAAVQNLSPEAELMALFDRALWSLPHTGDWEGTADELRGLLLDDNRIRRDADKLLCA